MVSMDLNYTQSKDVCVCVCEIICLGRSHDELILHARRYLEFVKFILNWKNP
jgi:hypothetical protein